MNIISTSIGMVERSFTDHRRPFPCACERTAPSGTRVHYDVRSL
jgi:hypothetical protein